MMNASVLKHLMSAYPNYSGLIKRDGTLDMRYVVNKEWYNTVYKLEFDKEDSIFKQNCTKDFNNVSLTSEDLLFLKELKLNPPVIEQKDSKGVVYIYWDNLYNCNEVKIGRSCEKNKDKRIRKQLCSLENPRSYEFETSFHIIMENIVHKYLKCLHLSPIKCDGGTEWYNIHPNRVQKLLVTVSMTLNSVKGPWDKVIETSSQFRELVEGNRGLKLDMRKNDDCKKKAQLDALDRFNSNYFDNGFNLDSEIEYVDTDFETGMNEDIGTKIKQIPITITNFQPKRVYDDNRCTETTQRGTRCKRRGPDVVSHSGYCWQHR